MPNNRTPVQRDVQQWEDWVNSHLVKFRRELEFCDRTVSPSTCSG